MKPATKLPWQTTDTANNNVYSVLERGWPSSETPRIDIQNTQDAAYIVHACNAYPELVEALQKIAGVQYNPMGYGDMQRAIKHAAELLRELGE